VNPLSRLLGVVAACAAAWSGCRQPEPAPVTEARPIAGRYVIDVRTAQEWSAGHIDGAILIPYDQIRERIGQQVPDLKAPIALYCRSGRRAGVAQDTLRSMGYEDVQNYGSLEEARKRLGLEP
jgi:phage shock protein E